MVQVRDDEGSDEVEIGVICGFRSNSESKAEGLTRCGSIMMRESKVLGLSNGEHGGIINKDRT